MKTLTLSAIALTLLTSAAFARDNDAHDTYKWQQSVSQNQTTTTQSTVSNSGDSSAQATVQQLQHDKGGHH